MAFTTTIRNDNNLISPSGRYEVERYLHPNWFENVYAIKEWVVDEGNNRLKAVLIARDLSWDELSALVKVLPKDE